MQHETFMHRCLSLAQRGQGRVGNGAMVGAVLVRDGKILAEAFHEGFGKPHAERALLTSFKGKILPSDVLYVNLEPCCHFGKTPPCTDIILKRGIRRVVLGMMDPDPRVSSKGTLILRKAGVDVIGPVLRESCELLNRGFIAVRALGRPWITLKRAQTRSGQVSRTDNSPLKITSHAQDTFSHTFLRAEHDAILVGVETIIMDDPKLNIRFVQEKGLRPVESQPFRIVLDPNFRIPGAAQVLCDNLRHRTIIVTRPASLRSSECRALRRRGVRVIGAPMEGRSFLWPSLFSSLTTPSGDFHGITSILVEGGRRTWKAFRKGGYVDMEVVLVGATRLSLGTGSRGR